MTTTSIGTLIIGGGVIGRAAAWQLARRGESVRLLERFGPHHTRGASHGSTRNLNNAYSEGFYLDLYDEALGQWRELSARAGVPLFSLHGLVTHGAPAAVEEAHAALAARGAEAELLPAAEAEARWPGMRFAGPTLFSREAGVGYASLALDALASQAEADGAVISWNTRVTGISVEPDGRVRVEAVSADADATEVILVDRLIVAAGAWSRELIGSIRGLSEPLDLPQLVVTEEHPAHFAPRDPELRWPSFNHVFSTAIPDARDGAVYGMPSPGEGVKVGLHRVGHVVDPDARTFGATAEIRERLAAYVAEWFPGLDPSTAEEISCTYTSTDTGRFVLDRSGPVTIAAGFSGHGYKFAPAIGRILADAATGIALPPPEFRLAWHRG